MTASNDAAALRAQRVQAGGNGLAKPNGQATGNPLATADDLRKRFAQEDERYEALREWVRTFMKEGIDFGTIPGCGPKPSLFKPGSEKLIQRFHLQPVFRQDTESWAMFGDRPGLICLCCELVCRDTGAVVGEGRGAARLDERKGWTENNCIKIAEKRAQVDAVLRTVGLSEVFTQDTEDMTPANRSTTPARTNNTPKANGHGKHQTVEHRDSERAQAWQRLRDCLLLFRAGGDERKAVRLRRCESDLRAVRLTARLLLAHACSCPAEKAHLAKTPQINALCDRLDQADGVGYETGTITERQVR